LSDPVPEPATPGTLARIARHLVEAVRPLEEAFTDADAFRVLMLELGWDAPGLPPSYAAVADQAVQAAAALEALADGAGVDEVLAVVDTVGAVHRAAGALSEAPEGIDPAAFLPELARRLFEYLLGRQLQAWAPGWYATLETLGIVSTEDHPPQDGRPGFVRVRFDWDQVPAILSDPKLIPARVYGWGTPDLDFPKVADLLGEIVLGLGLLSSLDLLGEETADALHAEAAEPPERPAEEALTILLFEVPLPTGEVVPVGLQITELPAEGAALPGLILLPKVPDGIAERVELGGGWTFTLRAGTDLALQLGVVARPGGLSVRHPGSPGQPPPSAGFGIALAYATPAPLLLFGQPGRTRLELAAAELGGALDVKGGDLELTAHATVGGLALVIVADDADGFLGAMLGGEELRVEIPLGLSWSSRTGLDFAAGAGFEVSTYPHQDALGVRMDRVDLGVRFELAEGRPPALEARAAASFSGELGPVAFSVDRLGVALPVRFSDGNAGPFDVRLEPLLPTGLGLVIDAGGVTGGGFVSFDQAKGRYAGVVELEVLDLEITAIAILDTRDAAGRPLPAPGFSFLLLVAAGIPEVELGFGFRLTGVGGLAAVNRRLDTLALLAGVRSGAVDSILFPSDPVRDAPVILSNLGTIFPAAPGRHVFAPMAVISWAKPELIHIELAVVVEVPAPVTIALLGTATVELPEDPPIVSLTIDVVGVLDLGRNLLAVDASLRDSRVGPFALAGDLSMRLVGGTRPSFALAVGGLHPHFEPPPGFPALRRASVALGAGENPRITIEGYLAVTANSRQFGAKAELYAAAAGFNVKGWLAFDALLTMHPFSFRFDFSVGMTLNRGSRRIAGIKVEGTLTGPNPFHAWGEGSISVLFFDISVPFDATFGEERAEPELPPADPWPLLAAALADAGSWSAELAPGTAAGVSLRQPEGAPGLGLLHPMGTATLRERVAPLNRTLERFGQFSISGPDRFGISGVLSGGQPVGSWTTVTEHFAPGEFEELSDTDQLSRDSFEEMDAGVRVGAATLVTAAAAAKPAAVEYETRIIDAPGRSRPLPRFQPDRVLQLHQARTGSKARATVAAGGRLRFARADGRRGGVVLEPERWAVASTDTLAVRADLAAAVTRGAAHLAVKHAPAGEAQRVQVVPVHELGEG
jgi:hypothetical protein